MSEKIKPNPQGRPTQDAALTAENMQEGEMEAPTVDAEKDYAAAKEYSTRAGSGATPAISEAVRKATSDFQGLATDEKLAFLYYVYEKMGDSITPANPLATEPELAPRLLRDYLELSDEEQLTIMRDLVEGKDTSWSRSYAALRENNQLLVWYGWAVQMGNKVVGMPGGYEPSPSTRETLSEIEALEFEQQISCLRRLVGDMGYAAF